MKKNRPLSHLSFNFLSLHLKILFGGWSGYIVNMAYPLLYYKT